MCWNLQVSLGAGVYGLLMSLFFLFRRYSSRDPWYAAFLLSFTCTQFLDAFFWARSDSDRTLDCDAVNLGFSKWVVTTVLFMQVWVITLFPSPGRFPVLRDLVRLAVVGVILLVGFISNCTTVVTTSGGLWPVPTLIYWGFTPPKWLFWIGVAFWSVPALLFIYPTVFATNILLVGGLNLVILQVLDGTYALVSKLCFFCLQLSLLWVVEPLWAPPSSSTSAREPVDVEAVALVPKSVESA